MRKILVTSALPYANGPIHLGHLLEYIQTDIWVRFQKQRNNQCYYVCADDAHGTAIMLAAEKQNLLPEVYIKDIQKQHEQDLRAFGVNFDLYHSTHSEENRLLAEDMYKCLYDGGYIQTKPVIQLYDQEKQMFLADRFIKGTCPSCKTTDQYGDACEACGATYQPTELIDAYSTLSGTPPVEKTSTHYFFDLPAFTDQLRVWLKDNHRLQTQVVNKLQEWFDAGLQPWDISRDAPYFGFPIPGTAGEYLDKYFYVWLDAPIGYMASFKHLCEKQNLDFASFWSDNTANDTTKSTGTELYHFIGKDIMYFHTLFWPAMLMGSGYRLPTAVFAHGFVTINGQKMSKSRGTFIKASDYLTKLNPEYLRYYFAAKLSEHIEDIDLNLTDFVLKVNADLVGKLVNLASRCAGFMDKYFSNQLAANLVSNDIFNRFINAADEVAGYYEQRNYSKAMRLVMNLADEANRLIEQHKPWQLVKEQKLEQAHLVCTTGLNLFRLLIALLYPVVPNLAAKACTFLNIDIKHLAWNQLAKPLTDHKICKFVPLMSRIEQKMIEELLVKDA